MTASRSNPTARGGMTLLEVLLATTVLASVMGLVAMLYGQAVGWSERTREQSDALRLHRVSRMLDDQWATRRTMQDPNRIQLKETIDVDAERLRFYTATPVLFPDWPLVVVEYRVETDRRHRGVGGQHRMLVYQETRVADLNDVPSPWSRGPDGETLGREIVLLDDCAALRWERFGPSLETLERLLAPERSGAGADEADGERRAVDAARIEGAGDDEEDPPRWRTIEEEHAYPVPAARLVGALHEERFTWPILAAPSR